MARTPDGDEAPTRRGHDVATVGAGRPGDSAGAFVRSCGPDTVILEREIAAGAAPAR